jgi:hypothetical protein
VERSAVLFSPTLAQIRPRRVHLLDQPDLFRSAPSFDLLFPANRIIYVLETLKPDEAIAFVVCRKTTTPRLAMFFSAPFDAVRDSAVKNVSAASNDVNMIMVFHLTLAACAQSNKAIQRAAQTSIPTPNHGAEDYSRAATTHPLYPRQFHRA